MIDFKDILAVIGIVLSVIGALPYIRDILKHQTKPHPITWLIWSLLAASGALVQLLGGGGLASLVLAFTAVMNIVIFTMSVRQATIKASRFDLTVLALAVVSLLTGRIAGNPDAAAYLLTFTLVMGYLPTFRKSIAEPGHETVSLYFLSGFKQLIGIAALSVYNVATLLFPAALVIANFALVVVLIIRRKTVR